MMQRPQFIRDEHLQFVDMLEEEIALNIFEVVPRILERYPSMNPHQAQEVMQFWMQHEPVSTEVA